MQFPECPNKKDTLCTPISYKINVTIAEFHKFDDPEVTDVES